MYRLLVAGGVRDPNVRAVIDAARARGVETEPLLVGEGAHPALTWDLASDELCIDDRRLPVTAVFVRRDVFHMGTAEAGYRAATWYATLLGWLAACPHVRILNRGFLGRHANKLHVLRLAKASGLLVPETIVTNVLRRLAASSQRRDLIAKPVPGGGYCQRLDELLADTELRDGVAASPAIVQLQLPGPDVRIYRIDGRCIGFRIQADAVDYRAAQHRDITPMDPLPRSTTEGLGRLMASMRLDWGAADFKADPESGTLTFLEINSDPMFSVFDRVGRGAITDAVVSFLVDRFIF